MRSVSKVIVLILAPVLVVGLTLVVNAQQPAPQSPPATGVVTPAHHYTGVAACGRCHRQDRTGNQLAVWEQTAHAQAFQRLASPEAAAAAAERGVTTNPQETPECLRCHTTAWGVPAEFLGEGFDRTQGVQCEACHGPGADYGVLRVMRDRNASVQAGLVIPDEQVCRRCHNPESPRYRDFNFQERYHQIQHPNPARQQSGG